MQTRSDVSIDITCLWPPGTAKLACRPFGFAAAQKRHNYFALFQAILRLELDAL